MSPAASKRARRSRPTGAAARGSWARIVGRRRTGSGRTASPRLLTALLHVGLHEVLGVGLEHVVDLVEEVVELGLDLLALSERRPATSSTTSSVALGAGFFFWSALAQPSPSRRSPVRDRPGHDASRSSSSAAVGHSSINTDVLGGSAQRFHHRHPPQRVAPTSNTSESQLAATIDVGPLLQAAAPEVGPGGRRRLGHGGAHLGVGRRALETRRGRPAPLGPQVVVLQVDRLEPGVVPAAGRGARRSRRAGVAWPPSRPGGHRVGIGLEPVSTVLPAAQHVGADLVAHGLEAVLLGVLAGPVEQYPTGPRARSWCRRRPARSGA
jgi:hypothetical protein